MTKPRSNRLGMYTDVAAILDAAIKAGGGAYICETPGMAIHWRQRAYRFRKLYAETHHPSGKGTSPYDALILDIPDGGVTVRIRVRRQVGVFVANEATAHDIMLGPVEMGDELFDEAADLAAKIERGEM